MKQDGGHKKQILATGQTVETTGQMLTFDKWGWLVEIKYKNGVKSWFYEHELTDISNSK